MFKSIFNEATSANLSVPDTILSIIVALVLGLVISIVYMISNRKNKFSPNFAVTLVILPVIVNTVIILVGSDITRAITLGGVFTLVRFRSVPGDSKDIANVFVAMAVGLATGMGQLALAASFTLIVGLVWIALTQFGYGQKRAKEKTLKITIPENLNYQGAFEDLFSEYTNAVSLERVKTTNMGTLFELTYKVTMKKDADEKQFIDSIRCRNGNLNIILGVEENPELML